MIVKATNNPQWQSICDRIANTGSIGRFWVNHVLSRLVVNAPVLLFYVTLCVMLYPIVHYMNLEDLLDVHSEWNANSIQCQTSVLTHILSHGSFEHVRDNLVPLLLVGPSVEHTIGSANMAWIIFLVAIVSGISHMVLVGSEGPPLQGAGGIVLTCILLHSCESANRGQIPVSFLLTAILFLGDDVYHLVYSQRDLRTPLVLWTGASVGAVMGWMISREQKETRAPLKKHA